MWRTFVLSGMSGGRRQVFREPVGDVSLVVRRDDCTACGPNEELNKLEAKTKEWCEVKTRGKLVPERSDGKEINILNRRVEWADRRIRRTSRPY